MRAAGIANFRTVGGKLAISTIFLVDLEAHFFRNMFSCSWSSEQHLALCLQCVSLLYCSKIPLVHEHDQTGVLLSMVSLAADHKTYYTVLLPKSRVVQSETLAVGEKDCLFEISYTTPHLFK